MDYNMMLSLLEEMYKVNNYEKDADYLFELIKRHVKADEKEKEYQAGVIKQFLFYTFLGAIDKKSKDEIYNINVNINEFRNKVEKKNPTWKIENYGAYKLKKVDDEIFSKSYSSYKEVVDDLKEWIIKRMEWIDLNLR